MQVNTRILLAVTALISAGVGFAHEPWILKPDEIQQALAQPKPAWFTQLNAANITLIAAFGLFCIGWIRLGFTGAKELFPDLQARLQAQGDKVAPIIRFCLVWTLVSASIGLEPRVGVDAFTEPTLIAADLIIEEQDFHWWWLQEVQLLLAVGLAFGVYVRLMAVGLLAICIPAFYLFGMAFLPYAGAVMGCALYLLLQGSGAYAVRWPAMATFRSAQRFLRSQPRSRAQFLMRVFTGISILYAGVTFKVFQPQLIYQILQEYPIPLLSSYPDFFTLLMALVEVSAGLLIIAGVLLRPLSLFFLGAFLFFAAMLPESFMAHSMFYGVMLSFLFNGAGFWRLPKAQDQAARIVIIGGGFAAVHTARAVERLSGRYTNVHITLVHDNHNLQFYPLLAEVVGGTMQPGNVVNPLRRICPQSRVVMGSVIAVDTDQQLLHVGHKHGSREALSYDHLILGMVPEPDVMRVRGAITHAQSLHTVGDALQLRQRVMDCIYLAEQATDEAARNRLLTFVVLGNGQRAAATAMAIGQLCRTAKFDYPVIRQHDARVVLVSGGAHTRSDFEVATLKARQKLLEKFGIEVLDEHRRVSLVTEQAVYLDDAEIAAAVVVNAHFKLPRLTTQNGEIRWPVDLNPDLSIQAYGNIWVAGIPFDGSPHYFTSRELCRLGADLGYNVWARTQNLSSKPVTLRKSRWVPYNLGRRSLLKTGPMLWTGSLAWIVSRFLHLKAVPGLERNLRVLLDWLLDIPFRSDVAVLATEQTSRLARIQFSAGDIIMEQGEIGDTAYLVEQGELEVLVDGNPVATLSEGECVGEIALVTDVPRTATVRCKTACELTVIGRDDMRSLASGKGAIAQSLQAQIRARIEGMVESVSG